MNPLPLKNREPIQRQQAEYYLLLTLLSFAASVSLTRLFLDLTGYPQIGNSELHIAHVLWGGVLLFIAALLPLVFANRWVYTWNAILAGVGVGLFIDEVGKFITQNNDYFYPAAAPIIYAFFMLTVLLYLQIKRRRKEDARTQLYHILDDLEEVLDHDLSPSERAHINERLEEVARQKNAPDLARLAAMLEDFVSHEELYLAPETPPLYERFCRRCADLERRWLKRGRYRAVLGGGLIAWGLWAISYPLQIFFSLRTPEEVRHLLNELVSQRLVRSASGLSWFEVRIGLEGSVGLLLLVAAFLLLAGKERQAISLAYLGLLLSLVVINLLIFYFDQFSTIVQACVQFTLLLGLLRYRQLYQK